MPNAGFVCLKLTTQAFFPHPLTPSPQVGRRRTGLYFAPLPACYTLPTDRSGFYVREGKGSHSNWKHPQLDTLIRAC